MVAPTPQQIGSLAKDESIRSALKNLADRFGDDSFQIVDDWDADLCAIGIGAKEDANKLVYISTYGAPEGRYNCHVDVWPAPGSDSGYTPLARFDALDFEGLVGVVVEHLKLSPRQAQDL